MTERQNDKMTKWQKDNMTKRQHDKKKDNITKRPFLRGLRVRKLQFCPQLKSLEEIALEGKSINDGRSNKCWQLKDKILFQSQLKHYFHFHLSEWFWIPRQMTKVKFKSSISIVYLEVEKTFLFGTEQSICQTNLEGWMVGVWDGTKLGWIPTDWDESQHIIFLSQTNPNWEV